MRLPIPRFLLAATAALTMHAALAQQGAVPPVGVPLSLQVQRLAPQLVAFAGSQANFEALVNGIALGTPVTLTTVDANGLTQTTTFTAPGAPTSSPSEIARTLETVRQQLIAAGVATPSAQQLGATLTGSPVPVEIGTTAPGVGAAAAGGTAATQPSPAEQLQSREPAPRVNTSDNRVLGNTSDSPTPPAPAIAAPPPAPPSTEAPPAARPAPGAVRRDR